MFLINLNNTPTIIEEKFIKLIKINEQWIPYAKNSPLDVNTKMQVLIMPSLDLAEAIFLYEGKNILNKFSNLYCFNISKT